MWCGVGRPLVVVGSVLAYLGGEVVRRADAGPGQLHCAADTAPEREDCRLPSSKTVDSLPLQNSSDAKITKLHHTRLRQKDILWEGVRPVLETPPTSPQGMTYLGLDVTVQDLAVVDVLQSQAQLYKPAQDLKIR